MKRRSRNPIMQVMLPTVVVAMLMCCSRVSSAPLPVESVPSAHATPSSTALSWQFDDDALSLCQGFYQQSITPELAQAPVSLQQGRTTLSADSVKLMLTGESVLTGDVVVTQPGRRLTADKAIIYRDPSKQQFTHVRLLGQVELQEVGKVLRADAAFVDLITNEARLEQAALRFASVDNTAAALNVQREVAASLQHQPFADAATQTLYFHGLTVRANARTIDVAASDIFRFNDARYTTCPPGATAWHIQAARLQLNRQSGFGSARNVSLRLYDWPVFYWPYLIFPIDNTRRSGVLLPLISLSKTGGLDYGQPFYWAMAPNYDFLFTPRVMEKRGVLWQGQFRYLNNQWLGRHEGRLQGAVISHDSEFNRFRDGTAVDLAAQNKNPPELSRLLRAQAQRDYINWHHHTRFNDAFDWTIDYHQVSDDFVLQDFGRLGLPSIRNQLPQKTWLTYNSEHWRAVVEYSRYQSLHPVNKPRVSEQYRRQPHVALDGFYPDVFRGLHLHFSGDFVDFDRKQNPGENITPEHGVRLHLQPGVSYPIEYGLAGFVVPRIDLALTHYDLAHVPAPRFDDITRHVPIVSVDAGLFLERQFTLLGKNYTHSIEPRIYYLYVPTVNQDKYPLFDTTQNTFSFDQLFRPNRFSGLDRLGDANQLSVSLTARLLDAKGVQKVRSSIGTIIYFRDRDVALCQLTDTGCTDKRSLIVKESLSDTSLFSPIVTHTAYNLLPRWTVNTNVAYDPHKNRWANANASLRYKKQAKQFFRLGFSFLRGGDVLQSVSSSVRDGRDLKQVDASFVWPVARRWHVLGRYHYNISHEYTQDYLAGLEYESCCWALRLVAGRSYKGLDNDHKLQYNRAIYLQWQMKGLATVGTPQPSHYLIEQIPDYKDTFAAKVPRF